MNLRDEQRKPLLAELINWNRNWNCIYRE